MRNHELLWSDMNSIENGGKMEILPSGQLRIPNGIAITKHIAQFWNPQNHGEIPSDYEQRETAVRYIAKGIDVPYEEMKDYTWAQHNLIWELHRCGNDVVAKEIASAIELTTKDPVVRELMHKTAALKIYLGLDDWGHDGLDKQELLRILKDIVKINADLPNNKPEWQEQWKQEMYSLQYEVGSNTYRTGFSVDRLK